MAPGVRHRSRVGEIRVREGVHVHDDTRAHRSDDAGARGVACRQDRAGQSVSPPIRQDERLSEVKVISPIGCAVARIRRAVRALEMPDALRYAHVAVVIVGDARARHADLDSLRTIEHLDPARLAHDLDARAVNDLHSDHSRISLPLASSVFGSDEPSTSS